MKAWVTGMPDPDVWRSVIRNHDQLSKLRGAALSAFALPDPESAPRTLPTYDNELLLWRAQLRPFLVSADGSVETKRPLESLSGVKLSQNATNLLCIGEQRRKDLFLNHFQEGWIPEHRSRQEPVAIALSEVNTVQETLPDSTPDSLYSDSVGTEQDIYDEDC